MYSGNMLNSTPQAFYTFLTHSYQCHSCNPVQLFVNAGAEASNPVLSPCMSTLKRTSSPIYTAVPVSSKLNMQSQHFCVVTGVRLRNGEREKQHERNGNRLSCRVKRNKRGMLRVEREKTVINVENMPVTKTAAVMTAVLVSIHRGMVDQPYC